MEGWKEWKTPYSIIRFDSSQAKSKFSVGTRRSNPGVFGTLLSLLVSLFGKPARGLS